MPDFWCDALALVLPPGSADDPWLRQTFGLALTALLLLGALCAALGVRVVNARLSFFTDAVGHGALAGMGLGLLLQLHGWPVDMRVALGVFSALFGLGVVWLTRTSRLSSDAATGALFSLVTAAGLVLVKLLPHQRAAALSSVILYGSVMTVKSDDLAHLGALALVCLVFLAWSSNRLALMDLDSRLARAHGVVTAAYEYGYAVLLALVVAAAARLGGILLVTALLILPAAGARGFARTWGGQFWWAQAIAATSAVIGFRLAAWDALRAPAGAAVALTSGTWFAVSSLVAWRRHARG